MLARYRYRVYIGIDLGLSVLAATSDGELIANPRHLRARERRLARAPHAMSRKQKGSATRLAKPGCETGTRRSAA